MDAKNSPHYQPTARSLPTDHEQVLPLLGKPPAWMTPNGVHSVAINNHPYHPPHPYTYPIATPIPGPVLGSAPPLLPSPIPSLPPQQHQLQQPSSLPPPPPPPSAPVQSTAPPLAAAETTRQDANKNGVTKARKPRKTNNASGGRSTLFWVHTDPKSVSEGTREETLKRIRSHVMSEHNRKKRLENTKRHKSKTWKHLAFQPVETTASSSAAAAPSASQTNPSPKQTVTESSFGARNTSESPSPSSSSSASSSPEQRHREEPQNALVVTEASSYPVVTSAAVNTYSIDAPSSHEFSPVQLASPWTLVGQGGSDPFNTSHTVLSDRMSRHLQHFFELTQISYPLQRRYGPKLKAHWAALVQQDPASLHACICVAASNRALEKGELPLRDPNERRSSALLLDTFHHRGETIRLVNEGLSDPIKASSDELIAAVSILLTIEIASGNPDYLKIHLAGLRQMVGMRNTFADVPPDVRFQISWTDIRVACMASTKPIFPFIRYTRPLHLALRSPHEDLEHTASRLIQLIEIPGIFGGALPKTIWDLLELTWYCEWIKSGPSYQEFDEETENYFNNEVLHVEYALHTDRFTPTGEVKGDASIEGCVRLACLLFHNNVLWNFYPAVAPVFPKPIINLRLALEATMKAGYFELCRDVLIWILFIGATSSGLLPDRAFFVNELVVVVRQEGIQTWQELRALLLGFFYVDRCYLGPLRELWDELQTVPVLSPECT
ncbi:uncharacterized protein BP01DRAFT_119931 [Aspergillus saccharolyticus JOP 1030-1]|uniref:Uncharacterized protein n=1 Tax=Aspergillus saccharolyticus JOP 1030-1 TaxID=1450539 RepID=A0A318ZNE5_9EURO|nr:hypothetical protein BP01DRAFT_119931 [Aspergillus saccharolyticus JOP 1030-1]PYH49056.1 hypothetical protein BP01DRAFT_119931 [Aspergillus saccharolyticus JOP 1030-1]